MRDISGYNNHGDWRNHASTTAPGVLGQGVELDGVNDHINAGNDTSLNFTGAFTVAAWVRTTVSQQNANIVAKHRSDYYYGPWRLQTDAGSQGTQFKMTIGDSASQEWHATGPDLASNDRRWVHVVGVFRPSTAVELWVDGNLVAQNTSGIPSSIPTVTNPLIIGARHTFGGSIDEYFAGYLDDVRVYNRALSAAEIQELYRLGR
ncbi:LamG domain-containing protein [Candidatus Parcubacteria bacterium]|nr:MAG: LamG domain-containing protein [Candidatus Parcubacteria bacterium]